MIFGLNKYVLIGGGVVVAALLGLLAWEKYQVSQLETRVAELKAEALADDIEIQNLQGVIELKEFQITQAQEAAIAANQRAVEADAERSAYEEKMKEILNALPEDDGAVAPILERILSGELSNN